MGARNENTRAGADTHPLYGRAAFLCGAARGAQLPPDRGGEVAFAGRSNVGKSSAINAITRVRSLARTSKTPGRTQQINFFQLDETRRLVDLPGYGYAKAPEALRRGWAVMVDDYLRQRRSLRGVVLLMDARRPLMALDWQLVQWCRAAGLAFCVVLTKCDKLSHSRALAARAETLSQLSRPGGDKAKDDKAKGNQAKDDQGNGEPVIVFSASRGDGIRQVRECLDGWLNA
ncbi:MAG: cell division checkpoint GTPase YihA [Candidatus Kentron sp. G]|nr:MAG: cell division checkpoint GTPase YihA [Candidatus Kentron sp. G]VFN00114.1 MAG: cell division checkpoint GTPase YihA [Candidatus Kentron sp. G]VFN03386.1 MAG: cell division checkpoint GTPase YihA [Candidatus Kentron sp. G]